MSEPDMELPVGKTCGNCRNHSYCVQLFGCKATSTTCDWAPSRFWPAGVTEVEPEPERDTRTIDMFGEG